MAKSELSQQLETEYHSIMKESIKHGKWIKPYCAQKFHFFPNKSILDEWGHKRSACYDHITEKGDLALEGYPEYQPNKDINQKGHWENVCKACMRQVKFKQLHQW